MIAKEVVNTVSTNYDCHGRDVVTFFGVATIVIAKIWELNIENIMKAIYISYQTKKICCGHFITRKSNQTSPYSVNLSRGIGIQLLQ